MLAFGEHFKAIQTWGQAEKLGESILGIDFSESEKEESSVSDAPGSSPEGFDLGIEGFCRGIGGPLIKEV